MNIIWYMKRLRTNIMYSLPITGSDEKLFFTFMICDKNYTTPLLRIISDNYEMFISEDNNWNNYDVMMIPTDNSSRDKEPRHRVMIHANDKIFDILLQMDLNNICNNRYQRWC